MYLITILKFPKVKVVFQQCVVRQSEIAVIDRQPITCLSSAKQQFVQLVLYTVVVSSIISFETDLELSL